MKTIALGTVGLLVLGVFAGGCSADIVDSGSVGETTQAFVSGPWTAQDNINDPTGGPMGSPLNKPRYAASSCVLRDDKGTESTADDVDLMLVAGGYDSTGQVLSDAYLYDPTVNPATGNQWTRVGDLGAGRAEAQMIQVPGSPKKCVIAGGIATDETTVLASAEIFELGVGWSNTGAMNETRFRFKLTRCGTSKLIAIGGRNNAGNATDEIDVFSAGAFTQMDTDAAAGTQGLKTARYSHGVAPQDNTYDQFLIAGGVNGGANLGSSSASAIELLSVNSSCEYSNLVKADEALTADLAELEVIPSDTSKFLVLGGTTTVPGTNIITSTWGLGASTAAREISNINWTTGAVDVANHASPLATARASFKVVPLDSNLNDWMILAGRGIATAPNPDQDVAVAKSQIFDRSDNRFEDVAGTANAEDTLVNGRHHHVAEYLPISDLVATSTGLTDTVGMAETNPAATSTTEKF